MALIVHQAKPTVRSSHPYSSKTELSNRLRLVYYLSLQWKWLVPSILIWN